MPRNFVESNCNYSEGPCLRYPKIKHRTQAQKHRKLKHSRSEDMEVCLRDLETTGHGLSYRRLGCRVEVDTA